MEKNVFCCNDELFECSLILGGYLLWNRTNVIDSPWVQSRRSRMTRRPYDKVKNVLSNSPFKQVHEVAGSHLARSCYYADLMRPPAPVTEAF